MRGPEMDFDDYEPNHMTMLEGLSVVRARLISERASRRDHIDVPTMGTLRNDRKIKDLAFDCRSIHRDAAAECLMMLALRRGCLHTAMFNSGREGKPTLMRLHLLSTFSSLRDDSFSVNQWVEMVRMTFGDSLPSRLIMLDHRTKNGSLDLCINESPHRDRARLERDCIRRYEALKALHENFGTQILNLPAGVNPHHDVNRAVDFIHRSTK